jgi:hypothetical protein
MSSNGDPMDRRPTNPRDANAPLPNPGQQILRSGSQSPATGYGNSGANNPGATGFASLSLRSTGKRTMGA